MHAQTFFRGVTITCIAEEFEYACQTIQLFNRHLNMQNLYFRGGGHLPKKGGEKQKHLR